MNSWVVKKFWSRVEQHLLEKKHLVFENNSICIRFDNNSGIYLYTDGLGFIFNEETFFKNFDGKVYIPDHIISIVKELNGP